MSKSNVHHLPVMMGYKVEPVLEQPILLPSEPPRITRKRKQELLESTERKIITRYYDHTQHRWLLRENRSKYAHKAVTNAVQHMNFNDYGATYCEVYEENTGIVHCQIKRDPGTGVITIIPLRHPKTNYVDPDERE